MMSPKNNKRLFLLEYESERQAGKEYSQGSIMKAFKENVKEFWFNSVGKEELYQGDVMDNEGLQDYSEYRKK